MPGGGWGGGGGGGGAGARGQNLVFLHTFFFYAPNFEKVGSILVSACAFVRSSVRPFKTEFKLGF